jgi:hypothetical protein
MSVSDEQHGPLILDLDDFTGEDQQLNELDNLRQLFGEEFQVTLFTIPGLCGLKRAETVRREFPGMEMVPHGFLHPDAHECSRWTGPMMEAYLDEIAGLLFEKGFKAPGWQITDPMYWVLLKRGYWVADQIYNRPRRPAELLAYEVDEARKIHGHMGHLGGHNMNELTLILPVLTSQVRFLEERRQAGLYKGTLFGLCGNELRLTGEA